MDLPFSAAVLDSVVGRYNTDIWPLQILAHGLILTTLALVLRPVRGGGRTVAAMLAALWAWVGIRFHWEAAATIDFAAPAYGAAFVAQAALLVWIGMVRDRSEFRFRPDPAGWASAACVATAIVGAPFLAALAGRPWASLPFAGTSPDPTALFTIGLLLLGHGRARLILLAIPLLWMAVAGLTAWKLGTLENLILPVIAVAATVTAVAGAATGGRSRTGP